MLIEYSKLQLMIRVSLQQVRPIQELTRSNLMSSLLPIKKGLKRDRILKLVILPSNSLNSQELLTIRL
jgi:hypothetical protein